MVELQRQREAEVGNERKRMRRINRERRQEREDVMEKMIGKPSAVGLLEGIGLNQHDVFGGKFPSLTLPQASGGGYIDFPSPACGEGREGAGHGNPMPRDPEFI